MTETCDYTTHHMLIICCESDDNSVLQAYTILTVTHATDSEAHINILYVPHDAVKVHSALN